MIGRIIHVVIRSLAAYIILLILGRIIGRKLISRITFFDFMVGVTFGSIAVRIVLGPQESPVLAALSLIVLTVLVVLTDYFDLKSIGFRKLIDGEPIILISNGKFLEYNMRKAKITVNKLMMQLREKNIFNLDDVAIAAIESDGELTVLPNVTKQQVTTGDLNISKDYTGLITDIIIDGKIIYNNLKSCNHDELWVMEQLKNQNVFNIGEVFYAGLNDADVFYVSRKEK